jgi:hypothetical protein
MTRISPSIAGFVLAVTLGAATAAPVIPPGEMPGRERDRFTESPVEKFMRPGHYLPPPLVAPGCGARPPHHSKQAKRKPC